MGQVSGQVGFIACLVSLIVMSQGYTTGYFIFIAGVFSFIHGTKKDNSIDKAREDKEVKKLEMYEDHNHLISGASEWEILDLIMKRLDHFLSHQTSVEILNGTLTVKSYRDFFRTDSNGVLQISVNSYWKTVFIDKCSGIFSEDIILIEINKLMNLFEEHYSSSVKIEREIEFFKRMTQADKRSDFKESRRYALELKGGESLSLDKQKFIKEVIKKTEALKHLED